MVKQPHEIEILFLSIMFGEPEHAEKQHDGASVARESTFPWHEYLQEPFPAPEVIVRLVEKAMPETGSDYRSYEKGIKERIQKTLTDSLPAEEPPEDEPSQDEPRDEKKGIPSDPESSYLKNHRIDMPMYRE